MRLKYVSALVAALIAMGTVAPVLAWNSEGHMVVAFIAFQHLTPKAKTEVLRLLKLNPQYPTWIAGLPAGATDMRHAQVAFVNAATWPDFIKTAAGYISDGSDDGDTPPPGPAASQNIGYVDKNRHKYWHFIDEPFSDDGTPLSGPPSVNTRTQIELLRTALGATGTSDTIKSYDVAWLAHLVGDVHQPLHATSRFTSTDRDGDNGGNNVNRLHCAAGQICPSNLHSLWDGLLGNSTLMTSISALGTTLNSGATPTGAADTTVGTWIQESVDAAKATAYRTMTGTRLGDPSATISVAYVTRAKTLAKQRVLLAGHRLARLINDAIG